MPTPNDLPRHLHAVGADNTQPLPRIETSPVEIAKDAAAQQDSRSQGQGQPDDERLRPEGLRALQAERLRRRMLSAQLNGAQAEIERLTAEVEQLKQFRAQVRHAVAHICRSGNSKPNDTGPDTAA